MLQSPSVRFLVQRIVGRIEVENDLPRGALLRLQKQADQKILDRHRIVADLVVARRRKLAQLQPVFAVIGSPGVTKSVHTPTRDGGRLVMLRIAETYEARETRGGTC
jgi:hypothetical protein